MKSYKTILIIVLCFALYLFADYLNIPSRLGIHLYNINSELLNILSVMTLFLITFCTVDRKQFLKERNKFEITKIILKSIYTKCIDNLDMWTDKILDYHIIPHCDPNKFLYEDEYTDNLINHPFRDESKLFELLKDGVVHKDMFEEYINCKDKYIEYLTLRLTFPDKREFWEGKKEFALLELQAALGSL